MDAVQTDWLTQTRFISPRLRDDIVPRPRLPDSLHRAIKSRALTLAATFRGISSARLSPQKEEDNPACFLSTLIGALRQTNPAFGKNLPASSHRTDPVNDARRVIGALGGAI